MVKDTLLRSQQVTKNGGGKWGVKDIL